MVVSHVDTPVAGHPLTTDAGTVEPRWTCALVNNMPDGAFVQTERQFLDLLDVGSGDRALEVRLYALAGVARGEATALRLAERYRPMAELYDDPPRLVVVTGANPVEPILTDEPIWEDLSRLLTWASGAVPSMLLSCLSAHAALTVFDGLERESLPSKCTGVFTQRAVPGDPMTAGLGRSVILPHSRVSTVPTDRVRAAGYDIPLESEEIGWSVATRQVDRCAVVLVQAHPEYGPSSLLREYQRDVRRFVRHERDALPVLPRHCAAPEDGERLEELQRRIAGGERDAALFESFPFRDVEARAPWGWRSVATRLYSNWLARVPAGSR
jgi:homoserine O-succinyltransferase/O-acetyltransferase